MGGLAILLLIGLYIGVAVWAVRRQKSTRNKVIALVIALLIPSADAIIGRIYLQHLCDTEGGLKVYRVVEGVEGFMEQGATTDYWVKNYGYQFTESKTSTGNNYRFSRQNGKIIVEENIVPKSKYLVKFESRGADNLFGRSVYLIEEINSKELLAIDFAIFFGGGWAERFLAQFSDAGAGNVAFCKGPLVNRRVNIVTNTLKQ